MRNNVVFGRKYPKLDRHEDCEPLSEQDIPLNILCQSVTRLNKQSMHATPVTLKAADTRPTNVGQHVFANNVGKQKSVVCSKSWPTFYVGQQCLPDFAVYELVRFLANKRQTVRCDWLAVVNIMAAEWTDASCVYYANYTSPFYLYIIYDCTQTDFGRLRVTGCGCR